MKCWECNKDGVKQFYLGESDLIYDKSTDTEKLLGFNFISQRWYCEDCFNRIAQERKTDRVEYIRLKKKLMFERAVRLLERQELDLYDYKEALEAVNELSVENPNWFDSAHEMVAAAIIIDNEIAAKHHYSVAGYEVDFFIPELKIVLEIDGYLHEHSISKDRKRDIKIRQALGKEYEIIRIGTKYLEENAELLIEAAKTMRKEKQKIRKSNGGEIPEWFSKKK